MWTEEPKQPKVLWLFIEFYMISPVCPPQTDLSGLQSPSTPDSVPVVLPTG